MAAATAAIVVSPTHDMYSQLNFVPLETYEAWYAQGLPIGCVLQRLEFPANLVAAFMEMLGATEAAHLSTIAYITVDEWEVMINIPTLAGIPVTPVVRSKMRHLLLAARCVIAVIRPSPTAGPSSSAAGAQGPAPATPPLADNAWDTLHFSILSRGAAST